MAVAVHSISDRLVVDINAAIICAFLGDVHLLLLVIVTLRNSEGTKQTSDVGWAFTFYYDHWNRVGKGQLTNLVALQLKNTMRFNFWL